MIDLSLPMFIPLSPKEPGKVYVHQAGQVGANRFSDIYSDHLEEFLWLCLNLLEHLHYFWYADFYFHGCFPFLYKVMGQTLSKGKAPFFLPFQNLHKRLYTTLL